MTPSPTSENRPQGWEATGAGPGDEPTEVKTHRLPAVLCEVSGNESHPKQVLPSIPVWQWLAVGL